MRLSRLEAITRLDLARLVQKDTDSLFGRIWVEPPPVMQLVDQKGSLESLNCQTRCGRSRCGRERRCTELALMPIPASALLLCLCIGSVRYEG